METPFVEAPKTATEAEHQDLRLLGVTVFLLSESMLFLMLFVAYITLRLVTVPWLPTGFGGLELVQPAVNTVVLVASSFVIYFAEKALDRHNFTLFRLLLLSTSVMGIFFLAGQAFEWRSLPFGLNAGPFGGTFYLLTGFHGLHVLTGVVLQLVVLARSFVPGLYTAESHFGLSATALFWHFVDVIWLVLFGLLYLWR